MSGKKSTIIDKKDNNGTIDGTLVTWADLNRITRQNCIPLSYIMNVTDDVLGTVYAWFKDDKTEENYLLEI